MESAKKIIKSFLPPIISNRLSKISSTQVLWKGDFTSWDFAVQESEGYSSELILEKVLSSTLRVKDGKAKYERDSVTFNDNAINFPLMSALLLAKGSNNKLVISDFGGALGSLYFQHKHLLKNISLSWNVVEQKMFYEAGTEHILEDRLKFKQDLSEIPEATLLILSSVVQYLQSPYCFLEYIVSLKVPYIFIDRTGFSTTNKDRLTVQHVPEAIYKASYPCWFLNEKKFLTIFEKSYQLMFEFDALDAANIPSKYKGYLFELRT